MYLKNLVIPYRVLETFIKNVQILKVYRIGYIY